MSERLVTRARVPFGERTGRDPWFDNARLFAVVLVVLGHVLLAVPETDLAHPLWAGLWPFRLPALVLLAGLFSSALPLNRRRLLVLARDLLLVFAFFSVIESVQTRLNGGTAESVFVPEYGLWFLLSLFCWRVGLPFLARVPHLVWWAVGAAALAGFVPAIGAELSLSRTIVYFPLFVLGWRLRAVDLHARPERRLRTTALVVAAALFVLLFVLYRVSAVEYVDFRMHDAYVGGLVGQAGGVLTRLGLLAAGALGALALVSAARRRRVAYLTYLGTGAMFIYLLHLVVMKQAIAWGWFDEVTTPLALGVALVVAVAVALVLASPPVRRVTRPLVQPRSIRLGGGRPAPGAELDDGVSTADGVASAK